MMRFIKYFLLLFVVLPVLAFTGFIIQCYYTPSALHADKTVINDVTKLNPIVVSAAVTPMTDDDVVKIVRNHKGPISIGGGRYSMGGQIGTDKTLFIDMAKMNKVLAFDKDKKLITVQAGARWKDLQDHVGPYGLSVKIMQTYRNFTVGGSLSVNVHGRYVGQGPLIMSVRSFKIVLADGRLVEASPEKNAELFYGAIGGYGGLGVITQATLDLADNVTIERHVLTMPITEYKNFFFQKVRDDKDAVFHNGDIYPPDYQRVSAVTWEKSDKPVTVNSHFKPLKGSYWIDRFFYYWFTELPYGLAVREKYVDPYLYKDNLVVKRNYEASYDVAELSPLNQGSTVYVLQEYFVPVEKFDEFIPKMRKILQDHNVKMVNISIRHAKKDPGAVMAWARQEVFAFVMYYKQGTSVEDREGVGVWTREMIDAVISVGGRYYLPYQPYATQNQFHAAYPDADKFFALKTKYDPDYKFRNKLWDKYYWPVTVDRALQQKAEDTPYYYRTEDQTFLTIPEWHIVFTSHEYADALKHRPSQFPYFTSIRQFWSIYSTIRQRTESEYPPNPGYNLMIRVIGVSTAAELAVKGVYENTIGRLTEWISGRNELTSDMKIETFMQQVATDYVSFIRIHPWYEYNFYQRFKELWQIHESPKTSKIRSIERRMFFSAELLFKTVYGRVIEKATHSTFELPDNKTWALVSEGGHKKLIDFPRYQGFTKFSTDFADKGGEFINIAGNKKILVTVITGRDWKYTGKGEVFTEWPILTELQLKRSAIALDAPDFAPFLRSLKKDHLPVLDHVFDY